MADYLGQVQSQAQKVYDTQARATQLAAGASTIGDELRKAVSERYSQSPLFGAREQAVQNVMNTGTQSRADISKMIQGGTILSPTQQQAITQSRRSAAVAPLTSLNAGINFQTQGVEGTIDAATRAATSQAQLAAGQAQQEQSLLDNLYKLAQFQEQQRQFNVQQASKGSSGELTLDTLMKIANFYKPTASQEQDALSAESGLTSLKKMDELLKKNFNKMINYSGRTGFLGRLIGGKDVQQYQDAARNAYDILSRTRTGAAMNLSEEQFYKNFVPALGDTQETASSKIGALNSLFTNIYNQGQLPQGINQLIGGFLPTVSNDGRYELLE